jgi:hypothetical protein
MTAIHYCAKRRPSKEIFKMLLAAGSDVNLVNNSGRTAIIIYLFINFKVDKGIIKSIMDAGFDL